MDSPELAERVVAAARGYDRPALLEKLPFQLYEDALPLAVVLSEIEAHYVQAVFQRPGGRL